MNTTVIKPRPDAASWLEVRQAHGYVSILRVFKDGTKLPVSVFYPEEVELLADMLSKLEAA